MKVKKKKAKRKAKNKEESEEENEEEENNEENKDNLTKVQKLFEDISNGRYANKKMTIRDKDRETATDLDSEIKKKLNSMGFSDDDLSHIDKSIIDDIRFCFS